MGHSHADAEELHCLGPRCFTNPHDDYVRPPYYEIPLARGERVAGRDYRWKVAFQVSEGLKASARPCTRPRLTIQRGLALPQLCHLGDDGRWRWKWIPLSLLVGIKADFWLKPKQTGDTENVEYAHEVTPSGGTVTLIPSARLKILSPLLGKLVALKPTVELLPKPSLSLKREFSVGSAKLTVRGCLQAFTDANNWKSPRWTLQLDWRPADAVRVFAQPDSDLLTVQYTKGIRISRDCKAVVAGHMDISSKMSSLNVRGFSDLAPRKVQLDSLKITQIIGTRARRTTPRSVRTYLKAAHRIGVKDVITVIAGHWIDPWDEPGAPGEREFNLEVADTLEKQLRGNGWEVLRPDRDAPHLRWEEYLNWVSKQTVKGIPVLEIHGQGSDADFRGLVQGVIGDRDAPLNKELAKEFGMFPMDWRDLAVPRRGGVILEGFNSDEVLQMAPWHRTWAVGQLASRITSCIERASFDNRARRGIFVDIDGDGDYEALCSEEQ